MIDFRGFFQEHVSTTYDDRKCGSEKGAICKLLLDLKIYKIKTLFLLNNGFEFEI